MKIALVSAKPYDRRFFDAANAELQTPHEITYLEPRLTAETAMVVSGHDAVCAFVNDELDAAVLHKLTEQGIRALAMRCAGYNNVDLTAAGELNLPIARVPAYSPFGVAEHALALMLTLNRKTHRAYNRVREGNFALEGLLGFEMRNQTVGVIGTGKIGEHAARLLAGVGCNILAYDIRENPAVTQLGGRYVDLPTLYAESDIITLHCPLLDATHHLINAESLAQMKPGVMLINTSRGALIDTQAVIEALKTGQLGYLGVDVYEEEAELFFEDRSSHILQDDTFARLTTFPNVLITGHQAFFTTHALTQIAQTTLQNLTAIQLGEPCENLVQPR